MRLYDVIKESPLSVISNTNAVVSSQSHAPGQVQEIKTLMRKHTLVLGFNNDGTYRRGGGAWLGPLDDTWTTALDDAIKKWKTSINYQITGQSNRPLDTAGTPVINRLDYRYLVAEVGTDGLLKERRPEQPRQSQPYAGQTYRRQLGTENIEDITSTQTFIDGIGWSGWHRLVIEILERKHESGVLGPLDINQLGARAPQLVNVIYSNIQQTPDKWYTDFRTQVLGNNFDQLEAILGDGTRVKILPSRDKLTGGNANKELYRHFARIIKGLWQKDSQPADRSSETPAGQTEQEVQLNYTSIARDLDNAMNNSIVGLITRGTTDEASINSSLAKIRTADDYNRLEAEYRRLFNKSLSERLSGELDDDEYAQVVSTRLAAIGRINPILLHGAIQFGDQEIIETTVDNKKYTINKNRGPNNSVVVKKANRNVKDVILQDTILRQAITETGGTVPDINVAPDNSAIVLARDRFISVIENTYPEMVAWYTKQEPFNEADIADIGGMRLVSIIRQAGRMFASGINDQAITTYIQNEILQDRVWLIGTEEEEGAAPIEFDDKYRPESEGQFSSSPEDDVELSDDEEDLKERLISINDSEKQQALREILGSTNPKELYEKIYSDLAKNRTWLEDELGNPDSLEKYIEADPDNSLLTVAISRIGAPSAAPKGMAELFKKAFAGWGRTDNELVGKLIDNITNRNDYYLINRRYKEITNNVLIKDMEGEEWWDSPWRTNFTRLANILGENIDLAQLDFTGRLLRRIDEFVDNPDQDTLDRLQDAIQREGSLDEAKTLALITKLETIVDNTEEESRSNPIIVDLQRIINELRGTVSMPTTEPSEIPVSP